MLYCQSRLKTQEARLNKTKPKGVKTSSLPPKSKTTENSSSPSKLEMEKTTQATSPKRKPLTTLIDSYAVQCGKCKKLRYIETQEKYEETRSKSPETCFECKSCEEPGFVVVDCDSLGVRWFVDQHGIPKTPQGLKRLLVVRENGERVDVYYESLQQKRLRSLTEVAKYIKSNEQFKDVKIQDVSFAAPKLMRRPKF